MLVIYDPGLENPRFSLDSAPMCYHRLSGRARKGRVAKPKAIFQLFHFHVALARNSGSTNENALGVEFCSASFCSVSPSDSGFFWSYFFLEWEWHVSKQRVTFVLAIYFVWRACRQLRYSTSALFSKKKRVHRWATFPRRRSKSFSIRFVIGVFLLTCWANRIQKNLANNFAMSRTLRTEKDTLWNNWFRFNGSAVALDRWQHQAERRSAGKDFGIDWFAFNYCGRMFPGNVYRSKFFLSQPTMERVFQVKGKWLELLFSNLEHR